METSYPVTAKENMSINNKIAKVVTSQSLMTNLKHLSADYDRYDRLYAAAVGMNTNFRQNQWRFMRNSIALFLQSK